MARLLLASPARHTFISFCCARNTEKHHTIDSFSARFGSWTIWHTAPHQQTRFDKVFGWERDGDDKENEAKNNNNNKRTTNDVDGGNNCETREFERNKKAATNSHSGRSSMSVSKNGMETCTRAGRSRRETSHSHFVERRSKHQKVYLQKTGTHASGWLSRIQRNCFCCHFNCN